MLNTIWIVGRIEDDPQIINESEEHLKIKVTVPRPFKNDDGNYDNDILPVDIFFENFERIMKYLNKGDLVGIKGRLATKEEKLIIYCEKLSFISKGETNDK